MKLRNWSALLTAAALLLLVSALLAGCSIEALLGNSSQELQPDRTSTNSPEVRRGDEKSLAIPLVYTTRRALSLTFNGMAEKETMTMLLDELDREQIKATFFLPGMRVAEEPDIAQAISERGHEIESNTLNGGDVDGLPYSEIDKEVRLGNEVIKKQTGIEPKYVRTKSAMMVDDLRYAAASQGMEAVVGSSLFLHNWQGESELEKQHYVRKYINRGGIIAIDLAENNTLMEDIDLLAAAADSTGYTFVHLQDLIQNGGIRKPLEEIDGYDAARYNPDISGDSFRLITKEETDKKEVALTFDDWGSDETITKILDLLERYSIKASFFLRADGVEKNPNLARAIAEEEHDVGNHTYSHPVITNLTTEQLQEEIVKAHRVITEAIQQGPSMMFRPPTGEFDDHTLHVISATGYKKIVIFDVIPSDYERDRSAQNIVASTLEQTRSGSIILLHLLDDTNTIEALPGIIEGLQAKGFQFKSVSDMEAALNQDQQ
ncbi:polysaccharide deacetylase family protein [Paenibacillus sp. HB172176]|uniref:polysaccharide deacetylase family protein n=1 Tax=Paenibacillus sp. HB172176 TaxID=2493690 RepID=UPI001F0E7F22|nr:polysaccharide deacetylase family protein [Paenibacillus sp. HB172176]